MSVVLFLDDDAEAEPTWSARLLRAVRRPRRPRGRRRPRCRLWQQWPPGWWPPEFGWVVGCSYRGQPTTLSPVRNLMGCNMSRPPRACSRPSAASTSASAGRRTPRWAARRPSSASGRRRCSPTGTSCSSRGPWCTTACRPSATSWRYFVARCRAEGVSKARIARRVGPGAALATESAYVRRVLTAGVRDNLDRASARRPGRRWPGPGRSSPVSRSPRPATSDPVDPAGRPPARRAGSTLQAGPCADAAAAGPAGAAAGRRRGGPPRPDRRAAGGRPGVRAARSACSPATATRWPGCGSSCPSRCSPAEDVVARLQQVADARAEPARRALRWRTRHPAEPGAEAAISVVVATRDRPELLRECLASILAGTVLPDRLVVVDNAPSTDDTATLVAELAADEPRLRYVREDRAGLARAHNAGLAAVTTPLVAFTDDDVVVDPRWLERLPTAFADDDQVGCVTGLIAPRELGHPAAAVGRGPRPVRQGPAAPRLRRRRAPARRPAVPADRRRARLGRQHGLPHRLPASRGRLRRRPRHRHGRDGRRRPGRLPRRDHRRPPAGLRAGGHRAAPAPPRLRRACAARPTATAPGSART